jgi:hypothetical protein
MSPKKLEERVAVLEAQMERLVSLQVSKPGPMDWLRSVGMFTGNEEMKVMDAECQALRDRERRQASARQRRSRRVRS